MKLVLQDQPASAISSTWDLNSAFPLIFDVVHVFRRESVLVFDEHIDIPSSVLFSHPSPNTTFSNCLFRKCPASGWRYRFRSRGSSMVAHDLGHLCCGRRIHLSGHSDFWILNNLGASSILTCVQADLASAACPSQSGGLAMSSITFAAVRCEADEPRSENTAQEPEPSFTMSLGARLDPCTSEILVLTPHFLRWQSSINVAKWTFVCLFVLPGEPPSCIWLSQLPSWSCL